MQAWKILNFSHLFLGVYSNTRDILEILRGVDNLMENDGKRISTSFQWNSSTHLGYSLSSKINEFDLNTLFASYF